MKKAVVLVVFAALLAGGVLVATDRARSLDRNDRTPPIGSISLPATVPSVAVEVVARVADPDSGVIEMRLSNDGATWSGWQIFPSPAPDGTIDLAWNLSPGAGAKTVVVEARNGVGLTTTFTAHTVLRPAGQAGVAQAG